MGLGMVIYQLIGRSGIGVALSLLGEQQASPDTRWTLLMLYAEIQPLRDRGPWSQAARAHHASGALGWSSLSSWQVS